MTTRVPSPATAKTLLGAEAVSKSLSCIAHEVLERNRHIDRLALARIHTRGVPLAHRAAATGGRARRRRASGGRRHHLRPRARPGRRPPARAPAVVRDTRVPFSLEGLTVIVVNDILYTGCRTIRFRRGRCDLGVNTPRGSGARADGYLIRKTALVARVPCVTTISRAAAPTHAIANTQAEFALSLQERIGIEA